MKKILIFMAILMISIMPSFAKNNYSVKFNGEKYHLLYSAKNPEFGGYINEYYKRGETYNLWSEMVGVHHFPNAYSPIDQIVEFRKYLNETKCPSSISFDEDKNTGIIDFIVIDSKHGPVLMEFNVFKYTKSDKCGSVALQYAQRYVVKNAFEAENIKKDFVKKRKKILKSIEKMDVPPVVAENIDKCAVANIKLKEENTDAVVEEKSTEKQDENSIENTVEKIEDVVQQPVEKKEETIVKKAEANEETTITECKNSQTVEEPPKNTEKSSETSAQIKEDKKNLKDTVSDKKSAEQNVSNKVKKENIAVEQLEVKKQKAKKSKKRSKKEKAYKLENSKEDFYSQPRDYKEIIAECKRIQKEQKKLKKINAKKAAKERAKKAAKKLEK